ncbi:MAG: hypothetical protein HQ453_11420 [Actinobacteria bacterium]|jgi:hypothetical protein|nr:hypothetical protein [Actinomycetota bacterium]
MKMFDVTASRSQGWWAIHANVPGASVWTQARRLDQVEATAREAIGLALDAAQDSFELNIAPVVPEGIRHEVELARNTARLAAIAQAIATTLNQYAAVSLTAEGYTVRDAGYLMNLSSQRISQLVAQQRTQAEASTSESPTFDSVVESLLAQLLSAVDGLSDTSSQTGETYQREEHGRRRTPMKKQPTTGKRRATAKSGPLTVSA